MARRRPDLLEVAAILLGIVLLGGAVRYMTRTSEGGSLPADAPDSQTRISAPGQPDASGSTTSIPTTAGRPASTPAYLFTT